MLRRETPFLRHLEPLPQTLVLTPPSLHFSWGRGSIAFGLSTPFPSPFVRSGLVGSLAPGVRSFGSARPGYPPAPPSTSREENFRRPFGIHSSQLAFLSSERLLSSAPLYSASAAGTSIRGRAGSLFSYGSHPPPVFSFRMSPRLFSIRHLWRIVTPEEDLIPPVESNLYPDDPSDEFYVDDDLSPDLGSEGLEASELLFKYLGDTYNTYKPAISSPAGEAPTLASDSGFFWPSSLPRSGITVPSDFLSEFDRIAAIPNLKSAPDAGVSIVF